MIDLLLGKTKWYHIVLIGFISGLFVLYLFQLVRPLGKHDVVDNDLPLNLLWTYHSKIQLRVPPKGNRDLLVIQRNDGIFIAFNNETGDLHWEYDTEYPMGFPQSGNTYDLDEDYLVTTVENKYLVVLNAQNGQEIWKIPLEFTSKATPEVLLLNNIVVIGTFSTHPSTEGYIVGYDLVKKEIISENYLPSRTYDAVFKCPNIFDEFSESTVCISHFNGVQIVDFDPGKTTNSIHKSDWDLFSHTPPHYQSGFIFTNQLPLPSIRVLDTQVDEQFDLPTNCTAKQTPYQISIYGQSVLASTGCNELYILDIYELQYTPQWTTELSDELKSSFVTIGDNVGYVLTEKAEITGIDLNNGEIIGSFITKPARLNRGKFFHALSENHDYLYVFLDGHQLFVFKR